MSPKVYGGMKSDEYTALNPQGLVPMLVLPDGKILWESDVSSSSPSVLQVLNSIASVQGTSSKSLRLCMTPRCACAQVIASYLCDKYKGEGTSFELPSPEDRANDLLARRVHDLYIGPIQVRPS